MTQAHIVHHMRETDGDLKKEVRILKRTAHHFGMEWFSFPSNQGKYRIDGYLYEGNMIRYWVECKWLSGEGFKSLNVPKYVEGCGLARETSCPFLYVFRAPGKLGYITVHSGVWSDAGAQFLLAGGTPPGRDPNWDDIEPMAMFNNAPITWIINNGAA